MSWLSLSAAVADSRLKRAEPQLGGGALIIGNCSGTLLSWPE
jgi:hypothetical protein